MRKLCRKQNRIPCCFCSKSPHMPNPSNSQKGPKEGVPVATDHSIANAQSKISSFPSCHQRFGDASAENPNFTQCPNSARYKNTQCPKNYDIRREASGRCILLPQNLRALRIFVPGTVRALLGHCAKPKFLQVVTASTLGELKNNMF